MRVDLRYGEGSLPVELSERIFLEQVVPQSVSEHPDLTAELLRVIESPSDSPPFSKRVSDVDSITIVVNRVEHQELIEALLHSLLNSIETFTFNPDNVSIIYPLHPNEREIKNEVNDLLGNPEARGHQLILHKPDMKSTLKTLGETPSFSTPVHINEHYLCADFKIGLGEIRPDVFFGATGGRMSVIPYVSGTRTITRNAKLRVTKEIGQFNLETSSCVDMNEITKLAGLDFIVNSVSDYQGNLAHIVAGNPFTSWKSGVDSAASIARADFSRRADIAIVSAGGTPYDLTLYDAIDSLMPACEITEHGGAIVLIAECKQDAGPKGFVRGMSEFSSAEEIQIDAETNFEVGLEKAHFFWNILDTRSVVICSRMRESMVEERLHCTAVKDPTEGLEVAQSMLTSSKKMAILNNSLLTLPSLSNH